AVLTGTVSDASNATLPYSSVYVKGSSKGTTANADGRFELELTPGQYTIVCTHVGYESQEKAIVISNGTVDISFQLALIRTQMKDVVVRANGEDPAYAIIRQAIKTRPDHLNEVKQWQVDVYMKGIIRTVSLPKSLFGVEFKPDNNIIDSSGKGIVYLAESVTKYSRRLPDDYREDIVSAKVSGRSQGFGFNSPNTIEFNAYEKLIASKYSSSFFR
ncbi:MAG: carboxypeptidase-like regulatory domain-containing protein, partial [Hymenobacter sp.]